MHDDPWKAALSRALVISQAGQLVKICTSGNICQWSCVGFGYRLHTTIGTWYPRLPTLFGESMFSFIPRIWSMIDFMFIILISASQILWRNRPEIQVFQVSATSFSWCKDRDESGVYPGWQCLGNVTIEKRGAKTETKFRSFAFNIKTPLRRRACQGNTSKG